MSDGQDIGTKGKTKVWDLPVRLFHILLIVLVGVSWYTAENMMGYTPEHQRNFTIHTWSGSAILALILFRIIWGFVGSSTARFSHFVKGPGAVLRYAKHLLSRTEKPWLGHNPLGGWVVVIMLGFLLVMPPLGMLGTEDTFFLEGPLSHLVDSGTSEDMAGLHHELWEIFSKLMFLHIAAAFFYLIYKRQNLIRPMLTGKTNEEGADAEGAETLKFRPLWLAIIVLAVTSGAVALAVTQL